MGLWNELENGTESVSTRLDLTFGRVEVRRYGK